MGRDDQDPSVVDIGERLRARRKQIGKTLQQVADECGLTVGFISQIERGISKPSLASLYSVAKALDAPVDQFISHPPERRHESVSHTGRRQTFKLDQSERIYEFLERGFPEAQLNACITHVPPGYVSDIMRHEGEDFVYLVRGKVIYEVNGVEHVLEAGDTLHFQSSHPHRLSNIGTEIATELWVGTMKVFPE